VLDGDPAAPTERGTAAPTFRPVSIVAKRSRISATAELLLPIQTVGLVEEVVNSIFHVEGDRLMLSDRCLSVCNVGVLWPNG